MFGGADITKNASATRMTPHRVAPDTLFGKPHKEARSRGGRQVDPRKCNRMFCACTVHCASHRTVPVSKLEERAGWGQRHLCWGGAGDAVGGGSRGGCRRWRRHHGRGWLCCWPDPASRRRWRGPTRRRQRRRPLLTLSCRRAGGANPAGHLGARSASGRGRPAAVPAAVALSVFGGIEALPLVPSPAPPPPVAATILPAGSGPLFLPPQ